MEAKDIQWCPQHGYPLPCDKCGLGQYELGKKAGMKEVVEWADGWCEHSPNKKIRRRKCFKCWQAKLKERVA